MTGWNLWEMHHYWILRNLRTNTRNLMYRYRVQGWV